MSDDDRYRHAYVDAGSTLVVYVEGPLGLIPPPTLEFYRSLVGTVTVYSASGFRLPLPEGVVDTA